MISVAFKRLFSLHSEKFLKNAEKELYGRIIKKLESLKENPFPSDAKRVVGRQEKIFRVRVGKYRIMYAVFYDKNEILIIDIDKRDSIYE